MTFYHLHYTELRINLMKHRHRISSFVVLIVRNKKLVVNVFARENYFYFKNGVLVQSPLASPGSLFAACSPPSVNASVFTSSRAVQHTSPVDIAKATRLIHCESTSSLCFVIFPGHVPIIRSVAIVGLRPRVTNMSSRSRFRIRRNRSPSIRIPAPADHAHHSLPDRFSAHQYKTHTRLHTSVASPQMSGDTHNPSRTHPHSPSASVCRTYSAHRPVKSCTILSNTDAINSSSADMPYIVSSAIPVCD